MKSTCSNCEAENKPTSKYCSICGHKLPDTKVEKAVNNIQKEEISKVDIVINLKTTLGYAVGFIIVIFIVLSFFSPSINEQIEEKAKEINNSCPMVVNQHTVLKSVAALPNKTIRYNYTLVNMKKNEVKIDTVKKYIFPCILENVKTNPVMSFLRENKVTLKHYYSDKNGKFVTEYDITPEMYK